MDWFLESTSIGRGILFDKAGKTVAKQTKGKYPAPLAILECAKAGMEGGHTKGSEVERQQFGKLAATRTLTLTLTLPEPNSNPYPTLTLP